MLILEKTSLWKGAFEPQTDDDDWSRTARKRLRQAFFDFRDKARILSAEMPQQLPEFTVHDVTHFDALWETGSLIAGSSYPLTPTEAFVLGGAFLVHDLAMTSAAYPDSLERLQTEPGSKDRLSVLLANKLGRMPTPEEMEKPGAEIESQLVKELLRVNHARQAARLPVESWRAASHEDPHYLIENIDLRQTYGFLIGQVAGSHWWPVSSLSTEFSEVLGAPAGYPPDWQVDPLKLVALLRVADAAHLDERRAPSFLRALRSLEGEASEHWSFQNLLLQPRLETDRLVYTAKRPFRQDEAHAWWLCYDHLSIVDQELRNADALLADFNRQRLAARSVARIEEPQRLAKLVKTTGWLPIDVRLKVSDVATLADRLGGEALYGDRDATVPVRELIQNACDAVRARRLLEGKADDWGEVLLRLGKDSSGNWIEVEDNGIGMSIPVISGPLLDFGTSFWSSELALKEHPGLLSRGFVPTGQYGVGFFSVFMLGDRIQVTTRDYREAANDTRVLEFKSGLREKALLRLAENHEHLSNGSTRIRVWLRKQPTDAHGIFSTLPKRTSECTIEDLCLWLCPAVDVNVYTEQDGERRLVVAAGDWLSLDAERLLRRVWLTTNDSDAYSFERLRVYAPNIRSFGNPEGPCLGRACVFAPIAKEFTNVERAGVVTVGGLRVGTVTGVAGLLVARSTRASRDMAEPLVEMAGLRRWASEQAKLVQKVESDKEVQARSAEIIRSCMGSPRNLPVAYTYSGWVSLKEIRKLPNLQENVLLVTKEDLPVAVEDLELDASVFVVGRAGSPIIWGSIFGGAWPKSVFQKLRDSGLNVNAIVVSTLSYAVVEAIARNWGSDPFQVLLKVYPDDPAPKKLLSQQIGHLGDRPIEAPARLLQKAADSGIMK